MFNHSPQQNVVCSWRLLCWHVFVLLKFLRDVLCDCRVQRGFGVYVAGQSDPWNVTEATPSMTARKCPMGWFGVPDTGKGLPTSNPRCRKCEPNQSTSAEGLTECDGEC